MSTAEVVLLDFLESPFATRVRLALAEKGVAFEIQEEDLFGGKSELLLKSNPIYQKVPVLLHDGKPICESTNIVAYVDEAWPSPPLLPPCAYGRAQSRFWADFVDKKVFEASGKIWKGKGEEIEVAKEEFIGILKQLEGVLGENDYFGGDIFGFLDIIILPMTTWFYALEKFGDFKVEDHCPKFSAWMKKCMERESAKYLPCYQKVYDIVVLLRKMNGIE